MHSMLSYVSNDSLPIPSCGEKLENVLTVLDTVSAFLAGMKRSTGLTCVDPYTTLCGHVAK